MKRTVLLVILLTLSMARSSAQAVLDLRGASDTVASKNRLDLNLEFLSQAELRQGALSAKGSDSDERHFALGRTRLKLGYERKNLELKFVTQNTAVWGMKRNMDMKLYEAWAKQKAPCGLFAQIGRQVLSYDDERIIDRSRLIA